MTVRKPPAKPARKAKPAAAVWVSPVAPPPPVVEPVAAVKRRRGKPAYVPTEKDRRTVEAMIGVGVNQEDLAALLEITVPTLHRHYRRELQVSYTKVVGRMRIKLIAKADAGDALCLIHVNKVFGWNDRVVVVDGGSEVDLATLSDEAIAQRLGKLRRSAAVARAAGKASGTVH